MRSATVTTILSADRDTVFGYLSDIENLPEWATEFARQLKRDGIDYKVVNGLGELYVDIRADRDTGVIDMYAGPAKDRVRAPDLGKDIERKPTAEDPSHGNIIGPDSMGRRRKLARIAQEQWAIEPDH